MRTQYSYCVQFVYKNRQVLVHSIDFPQIKTGLGFPTHEHAKHYIYDSICTEIKTARRSYIELPVPKSIADYTKPVDKHSYMLVEVE